MNRNAVSSAAPATKNAAACAAGLTNPAAIEANASRAAMCAAAPGSPVGSHANRLLDRVRAEQGPRTPPRHRPQRQHHAEERRNHAAREADREARLPHMQLEERRPHRPDPPGFQTEHDEGRIGNGAGDTNDAACERDHRRLGRQHPAEMTLGIPGGSQHADLAEPLFDAEPEEQHHEQQRRDDDEEAEVGEVLAEIGGAARGLERLPPRRRQRDALRRPARPAAAAAARSPSASASRVAAGGDARSGGR